MHARAINFRTEGQINVTPFLREPRKIAQNSSNNVAEVSGRRAFVVIISPKYSGLRKNGGGAAVHIPERLPTITTNQAKKSVRCIIAKER